jgi:hypothetical protein
MSQPLAQQRVPFANAADDAGDIDSTFRPVCVMFIAPIFSRRCALAAALLREALSGADPR